MAAVAERLVGRADEIGSIEAALSELEHGRPATLELVGEPGIGKTRLLAELAARADALGFLVLSGRAAEMERDLPFWVFVDALDEYVEGLDPRRLEALDEDVRAELATVLPSLSALATGRQVALQHERYRSHRAVRELLELLASAQPLILVLDDLHWADEASLELLGAILRRVPAGPVLMALAVRPRQVPERLSSALERAHRDGTLTRLELRPLSPREADELLGETIGGADTTVIYEESGGNPFYLQQLARTIGRPAAATAAPGILLEGMRVPPTVAAALAEELALLTAGTRRVLEGAAVAGDPVRPRARRGGRRNGRAGRAGRPGRAAAPRPGPTDGRAAAVPLPAPARAADGLRVRSGGLAARRPRAQCRRPGRPGSVRIGPGPPRRARGAPGRRRRGRRPARGGRGGRAARSGERRALVRRRRAPAPRGRARAGTGRAAAGALGGAGRDRPVRRAAAPP